jgi:hypothetical protein
LQKKAEAEKLAAEKSFSPKMWAAPCFSLTVGAQKWRIFRDISWPVKASKTSKDTQGNKLSSLNVFPASSRLEKSHHKSENLVEFGLVRSDYFITTSCRLPTPPLGRNT